jgi:hypothetical protein
MPRYRIHHRPSSGFREIEAPFAQEACNLAGWMIGDCLVEQVREEPLSYLQQPNILISTQQLRDLQTAHALARQALHNIHLLSAPAPLDLETAQRLLRRIHQLAEEPMEIKR